MESKKFRLKSVECCSYKKSNYNCYKFDIYYNNKLIAEYERDATKYNLLQDFSQIRVMISKNNIKEYLENLENICEELRLLLVKNSKNKYSYSKKITSLLNNEIKNSGSTEDEIKKVLKFADLDINVLYEEEIKNAKNFIDLFYNNILDKIDFNSKIILYEEEFKKLIWIYYNEIYMIQENWNDLYDTAIMISKKNDVLQHNFLIDFSMIYTNKYIDSFKENYSHLKQIENIKKDILSDYLKQNPQYNNENYYLNVVFKEEIF